MLAQQRYNFEEERDVNLLANDLSDWTGVILKIEGLLNWESPRLLVSILLIVSVIFLLLGTFHPAVLTMLGWFGLTMSIVDFIGPTLSARVAPEMHPLEAQKRYREFCRRLVHARYLVINFFTFLQELRANHPIAYLFTSLPLLLIGIFVGRHINDLLLLYILTIVCILTPGLRYKGFFTAFIYLLGQLARPCARFVPVKIYTGFHAFTERLHSVFWWVPALYRRVLCRKKRD
ncbi:ADP-ribosylation factor-like protein 6-interacting protein 1 [Clonorchis sinensis]|uniref:ADP-ribosylation factor-like protein 6-interacting protein 1 n=3 Tax=Clonorchis sinensis TaxID=79923 RepID=A0A8T1M189_CLOSI|nr:ADP-ribosylation factor-like protein 6-interacting protein 1 [Clonorchis sinensis]